jgi:hypothetical protein
VSSLFQLLGATGPAVVSIRSITGSYTLLRMSDGSSGPPSPRSDYSGDDSAIPAPPPAPVANGVVPEAAVAVSAPVVEEPLPPATAVWSLDQLRRAASRWSLAADSGVRILHNTISIK